MAEAILIIYGIPHATVTFQPLPVKKIFSNENM
jgi:hypothetical protein